MRVELVSESASEAGGYKEIVFGVKGGEPYRWLKHESGVHRVQRVPGNRSARPHPHEHRDRRRAARRSKKTSRSRSSPVDLQIDTYKVVGRRRPVRQQDRVRDSHHARSDAASSWPRSRSARSCRIARRRCRCCARRCYDRKRREQEEAVGSMRRCASRHAATAPRRFAPTTFRKTASPTTGSTGASATSAAIMDGDLATIVEELARGRARPAAGRRNRRRDASATRYARAPCRASRHVERLGRAPTRCLLLGTRLGRDARVDRRARRDAMPRRQTPSSSSDLCERRAAGEPLAYVLGKRGFYGREFCVERVACSCRVPKPSISSTKRCDF